MEIKKASAEDVREILRLMDWTTRELAGYWDITEAAIYQWLSKGEVARGTATWCVLKTLEEARANPAVPPEHSTSKKPREKATA